MLVPVRWKRRIQRDNPIIQRGSQENIQPRVVATSGRFYNTLIDEEEKAHREDSRDFLYTHIRGG